MQQLELKWTVAVQEDPRTTKEWVVLQTVLGPIVQQIALEPKMAESIAQALHTAAEKCGHIIVKPTEQDKRMVKLAN